MKILLVVIYISYTKEVSYRIYEQTSITECKTNASIIHKNVRAGKVYTKCL